MKREYDIKKRRLELGLTLEAVGKAVGVGKSTVRKWETGFIKNMRIDKIAKLSKVLKISPNEFIGLENEDNIQKEGEKTMPKKKPITIAVDPAILERIAKIQERLDYITQVGVFEKGAVLELERLEKLLPQKNDLQERQKPGV